MRARDRDRASTGYTGPATLYRASYSLPGRDWLGTDMLPGTALAQAAELHGTKHIGTQAHRPLSEYDHFPQPSLRALASWRAPRWQHGVAT